MPIEIDMSDGWNPAAAWYALALLVDEGERIRELDDIDEAKRWKEAQEER